MSSYSGNCLCFRTGEAQSQLTNSHSNESDMVYELIGIVCSHTSDLLPVAEYVSVNTEANPDMTQEEYTTLLRNTIVSFNQLVNWCQLYDVRGDFNNFEVGWSISMSVYS